ncbi:MAG TPA: sulfatase-like hydrolase/transferase [Prosthecobacter sp.]|nr:sulfatase-like hydrolase/transferase [Prosthecobacter sp.]
MRVLRFALFACLTACPCLHAARPNVLLIVTDDQRPDTIRALGNPAIETPNLDRLAARGTSFTRAYAGYPICYASRAEILTGCTSFRAFPKYPAGGIDPALKTFAGTFQEAGYQTWYSGKWHNDGHPTKRGYLGTRGLYSSGGAKNAPKPGADERGNPISGYTGWTFKTDAGKVEIDKGVGLQPDNSRHIADGAIAALGETPKEKPFFLHVNFAFPHDPRMWPEGGKDRYEAGKMPLPKNFAVEHPFDHGNLDGRDELLLPRPRTEAAVRRELAIYYAMIHEVDAQVGRILGALEAAGRLENTLVIFTSDQGLAMGSHGLLGKQNQYEHSIRAPLILAGPRVSGGRRSEALVMLRDLFPTCCEFAGVAIPATVQGRSLWPLLEGKTTAIHDYVTGTFTDTQRMICDQRWKYVWYPKAGREQFFDLQSDPEEMRDLSGDEKFRQRRDVMRRELEEWCRENGDKIFQ